MGKHYIQYTTRVIVSFLLFLDCQADEELDNSRLSDITVTATRNERTVFNTPQAVTIITQRQIVESNAATTPDILAGEAGVYIQKSNTGGGSPFIRGLTGKQVLILVDGVRLNNSFYRFGPHQYLNTIDPHIIERIEVVRGPMSVLYGSDALGGVINIITKGRGLHDATLGTGGLLNARAASADSSIIGRAQFEHYDNKLALIGGITGKRFNDLRAGGDIGQQEPTGYDEANGDIKLNYRLADNHEFIFSQQYLRQFDVPKTHEVTLGSRSKFNYEPQIRSLTYGEYHADRLDNPIFDSLRLNLSYNYQEEGEEIIERATPNVESVELTEVGTFGVIGQFTKSINNSHRLTYGFDYYDDSYDTSKVISNLSTGMTNPTNPGTPDGTTYTSYGIYLQDEIRLGDRVELIPGIRYAKYEADGEIGNQSLSLSVGKATGSVNGLFRLTNNINLVAGVAQGFRAPNMEDFFGRVDFISEIPNTSLEPETSINREIGIKYNDLNTFGSIFYFESDYEDLITRTEVAPGVVQRQNLDRAEIYGVEAELWRLFGEDWEMGMTLAYTRGEDKTTGEALRRIPPLNGSLHVRYKYSPKTWFELNALLASNQDRLSSGDIDDARIPPGGTPGYTTLNFLAGHRFSNKHEIILSIENITDKKYKTHGSGVFEPGINLVASYILRM